MLIHYKEQYQLHFSISCSIRLIFESIGAEVTYSPQPEEGGKSRLTSKGGTVKRRVAAGYGA